MRRADRLFEIVQYLRGRRLTTARQLAEAWRKQGRIRHFRMQRFRGDSDSHLTMARLEVQVEQLQTRPADG